MTFPEQTIAQFAQSAGLTLEAAQAKLRLRVQTKRLARKPQQFDTSELPLFSDAHKQRDLFEG
jgi:hypothetical protein